LDEDVDVLIATLVRSVGFRAVTVHDGRREGMSDADQLAWATSSDAVFVTHNRGDFARLGAEYHSTGRSHDGIVIAKRRSAHEVAARLVALLNAVPRDDMRNTVRYI
jgi:hypothetical protein